MKRKFYTLEEFRHVRKEIEAEYFDKIYYASKNLQEKAEILFGRRGKTIPNDFLQRELEERGFLYDPLGDNIEQTLCCFDIFCQDMPTELGEDIPSLEDLNWFVDSARKRTPIAQLNWKAAVKASSASEAIEKYAEKNGFIKLKEDEINPYLFSQKCNGGVIKVAIFAK